MKASESTIAWISTYYEAIDSLDFRRVAEFLHHDCVCIYPGGQVQRGSERILKTMAGSLGALARIRHDLRNVWEAAEQHEVIFELEVSYWREDGQQIVRPGMGVFVVYDGKIREQRLVVDARGVWD